MNQLKTLLSKLKRNEVNELREYLKMSRGRSKRKFELFRLIDNNPNVTRVSAMKRVYGNSENAKENFRKLKKRLENDLLNCLEKRNQKLKTEGFSSKVLLQLKKIDIMINNSYSEVAVLNEIEDLNKQASSNQMFLNKVLLERIKCESFYLTSCPIESLKKVKKYHELSKFVSLSNFFHLSCKRYFFYRCKDKVKIETLKELCHETNEYYMKTGEPLIGYYYHLGSIIISFITESFETCNYHNKQIVSLQNNYAFLKKHEYSDEYIIIKALCLVKQKNKFKDASEYIMSNFSNHITGSFTALLERIKYKPFEIDLTIQLLMYQGGFQSVLSLIKEVSSNPIFKGYDELKNKFDLYSLSAYCGTGDYISAKILFDRIKNSRKNNTYFRYYRPLYEFILYVECSSNDHYLNYESFQRFIRRNLNEFKLKSDERQGGLQEDLTFLYLFIRDHLNVKKKSNLSENCFVERLQNLRLSYSNEEIHISLFLKWVIMHYFGNTKIKALTTQYQ